MATTTKPRAGSTIKKKSAATATATALNELPLSNIQNKQQQQQQQQQQRQVSIDSLTRDLDNFHIRCVSAGDKENLSKPLSASPGHTANPAVASTAPQVIPSVRTCGLTREADESDTSDDFETNNTLARASQHLPSNQEQLAKHQAGQFEWLLSIPVDNEKLANVRGLVDDSHDDDDADPRRLGEQKRIIFGCNLLRRGSESSGAQPAQCQTDGGANVYTLIATRLDGEEDDTTTMPELTPVEEPVVEALQSEVNGDVEVNVKEAKSHEQIFDSHPSTPVSKIEAAIDAVDRLEEQIEQLTLETQPKSATAKTNGMTTKSTPIKRATSVKVASTSKSAIDRKSAMTPTREQLQDNGKPSTPTPGTTARKVPRPASLNPPKPLAKSSKPPTIPSFELPGEAVARRLKEQREARLSQQISPEQAASVAADAAKTASPSSSSSSLLSREPKFKSSKPPTRPTFELPGEAISRRKREQHEAKLRAEEEEMRRRREFKARPMPRASIIGTPSTLPRDTVASLARINKQRQAQAQAEPNKEEESGMTGMKKRHSIAVLGASSSSQTVTRGRTNTNASQLSQAGATTATTTNSSRATSASGSVRDRRASTAASTVSNGSVENGLLQHPRDSKEAVAAARKEAAERSRMMSRLWAEKRKAKEGAVNGQANGVKV
ncbi:uncharacterized protein CTHT_0002340 [Thermochaetoides thermophila DSM 1495]|uniref:Carboxylesterase family protein n=1 Tax=Chaetomium thermophilum (strain DSM 1495 / CBS 144.50 / IMI 039719) TaxID=759272 RepID=G0RZB2_CHATD|nr:hypothetical protein CTHT_0002340 [Thermochaetoides thermophila DSM 1495]EGS23540.1 hypothetical protein CTHT_0002340 [Thermochaetoides thermophila DSM 1495]